MKKRLIRWLFPEYENLQIENASLHSDIRDLVRPTSIDKKLYTSTKWSMLFSLEDSLWNGDDPELNKTLGIIN
jgi:hypothetical protein